MPTCQCNSAQKDIPRPQRYSSCMAGAMVLVAEEACGGVRYQYRASSKDDTLIASQTSSTSTRSIRHFLRTAFLPEGYPHSVSSDYLAYQIWDSIQALCSSITGMLSTHAILTGVGVGEATATATAATAQWYIRDGSAKISRILFAWARGTDLDCNSKTWRYVADILNDLGTLMEILSPAFPGYFLLIACIGSILKAIVGVAGGATRAAFTEHQARRNNMADVAAKDGSQETALGLLGLLLGLTLVPAVSESQTAIWMLFIIFSAMHLFANYMAVGVLIMETFNQQRGKIAITEFLDSDGRTIPSPKEVTKKERLLSWELFFGTRPYLVFGARLEDAVRGSAAELSKLVERYRGLKYFLACKQRWLLGPTVYVVFHDGANAVDYLRAFYQSVIARRMLAKDNVDLDNVATASLTETNKSFDAFLAKARESGWNTEKTLLKPSEWSVRFFGEAIGVVSKHHKQM